MKSSKLLMDSIFLNMRSWLIAQQTVDDPYMVSKKFFEIVCTSLSSLKLRSEKYHGTD